MSGWLFLIVLALLVLAALWRFARLDRTGLQLVASALLLAMAGYAWQGRPGLEGRPTRPPAERAETPDGGLPELRRQMFGRFDAADRWLILADSYQRRGDTQSAAGAARAGLKAHPRDATLWVGLGNALVAHSGGMLTPAAELAYRRAIELAPAHPGPRFFFGLALAQNGRLDAGERLWVEALALAPPDIGWRPVVERQLELLRQAKAMGGQAPR
jgi:cytochrome c-type biogenesis protein CcmH/NrfG